MACCSCYKTLSKTIVFAKWAIKTFSVLLSSTIRNLTFRGVKVIFFLQGLIIETGSVIAFWAKLAWWSYRVATTADLAHCPAKIFSHKLALWKKNKNSVYIWYFCKMTCCTTLYRFYTTLISSDNIQSASLAVTLFQNSIYTSAGPTLLESMQKTQASLHLGAADWEVSELKVVMFPIILKKTQTFLINMATMTGTYI